MKLTPGQVRLREEAKEFSGNLSIPKSDFQKLLFLYYRFEKLRNTIRNLPGGYDAFKKKVRDYSDGKISKIRTEIEDEILSVEDHNYKKKKLQYNKIVITIEIEKFVEIGERYVQDLRSKYKLNTSWVVYFYELPLSSEYGRPSLGTALLRSTNDLLKSEFFKKDFSYEPYQTKYIGEYKYHTNEDKDDILTFELKSSSDRSISIVVKVSGNEDEISVSGLGTFSQYDGKRIYSSRILMIRLGEFLSETEAQEAMKQSIEDAKSSGLYTSYLQALKLRSANHICSLNKMQDTVAMLWSSEVDANSKFIDALTPAIYISSDILILHDGDFDELELYAKGSEKMDLELRHQTIKKSELDFFYFFQKKVFDIGRELQYLGKPDVGHSHFVKYRRRGAICIPSGVTYFIHFETGYETSSLAMTYLGWAMSSCKHLLFIYDENKTSDELLDFLKHPSIPRALSFTIRFLPYKNLKNDMGFIERTILEFVEHTK